MPSTPSSASAMRFDEAADVYDLNAHVQHRAADWCAEWLDSRADRVTALELGAGTGLFTRHLVNLGFSHLRATDRSWTMLRRGRAKYPACEWRRMDAWNPQGPAVQRLYSTSLLQWAPDPDRVLMNWRQLLHRGGKALVFLFVEGSLRELEEADLPSALQWRSAETWLASFERAGFAVERSQTESWIEYHPSAVAALRQIHQTGAVGTARCSICELRRTLALYEGQRTTRGVPLSWCGLRLEAIAV